MHPNVKQLVALQNVDLRLNDVRARLATFPKHLSEVDARLALARDALAKAKEGVTAALKERKKYELDVDQWKEKLRKYKDQIYEVKTNEAYKALQHEIQTVEAEIAKAEDRLLEKMVAGEEFERQVKAADRALKEAQAAAQADRARIETEQKAAENEQAALMAERDQAIAGLPDDLLDHYQRIARRHNGVALAPVRNETCTMCRVRVRPHVFQELRRPDCQEIFHCETCTRILYYEEEPVAQTSASASSP